MEEQGLPSVDNAREGLSGGSPATQRGPKRKKPMDLFMSHVEGNWETGCWEWRASGKEGYGHFKSGGKTYMAHRWSWEFVAELPLPEDGLDHICRNPPCVRPGHLQPASGLLNTQLRDERKNYQLPEGAALYGPTKHWTLMESVRAMQYRLPSAWNMLSTGLKDQIIPAESDGKRRQKGG